MTCKEIQRQLGSFVDGELDSESHKTITAHVEGCELCRKELDAIQSLATHLAAPSPAEVPENLWTAIEERLNAEKHSGKPSIAPQKSRIPFRAAAMIALAVGVGSLVLIWADKSVNKAEASPINFGIILDTLPVDAEVAFRKFLELYEAKEIHPREAKRLAPKLNFGMPEDLPGGFRRKSTFALNFGGSPGIVARYERQGEFLVAIFHATVFEEDYGTHRDYPCVVGKHRGQKVEVGAWSLVHVTDPTTCHCVLSRLDESTELPDVLSAVAPGSIGNMKHHHGGTEH